MKAMGSKKGAAIFKCAGRWFRICFGVTCALGHSTNTAGLGLLSTTTTEHAPPVGAGQHLVQVVTARSFETRVSRNKGSFRPIRKRLSSGKEQFRATKHLPYMWKETHEK